MLSYNGAMSAAAATSLSAGVVNVVPGPLKVVMGGLVYAAVTGIDYRMYKRGEITKDEFKSRAKVGAVGTVGGVLGSSAGMIGGFALG